LDAERDAGDYGIAETSIKSIRWWIVGFRRMMAYPGRGGGFVLVGVVTGRNPYFPGLSANAFLPAESA
jgi:hypothetical protein